MKNLKVIPKDKYRVIKISKDALFEFIYESMIDANRIFSMLLQTKMVKYRLLPNLI